MLLHELGHALAARQFGIPTRDITLLPIGGVAALERMPRNPLQELWIAVAGPLVNVVIATVLMIGLAFAPPASTSGLVVFFWQLALANVVLVVFNMIPAFPMDGGRVLRSVLALLMDWHSATRIAVAVGKVSAVGLGLLGLLSGNLILVLVAVFVFFAAQSELVMATRINPNAGSNERPPGFQPTFGRRPWDAVQERSWFDSAPPENRTHTQSSPSSAGGVWVDDEVAECSVPASLSANSVAAWLTSRRADNCLVVDAGRTIGTITKSQLLSALARGFGNMPVGQLLG